MESTRPLRRHLRHQATQTFRRERINTVSARRLIQLGPPIVSSLTFRVKCCFFILSLPTISFSFLFPYSSMALGRRKQVKSAASDIEGGNRMVLTSDDLANMQADEATYQYFGVRQLNVVHPPSDYGRWIGTRCFTQQMLNFGRLQIMSGRHDFHFLGFHC